MPVNTNAHQTQLPATPVRRTMSVTRLGVSLEKVVATVERPASHHGTLRPEAKKSAVVLLERRATRNAGKKQISSVRMMTIQSRVCSCMLGLACGSSNGNGGLVQLNSGISGQESCVRARGWEMILHARQSVVRRGQWH